MNSEPYNMGANFRRIFKPAKSVAHQQTCPECGRTLVNLYRRGVEWKCRRCWEEAQHG